MFSNISQALSGGLGIIFRIDKLDANGEVFEHGAGLEDFELAVATYEAACKRWLGEPIMLRQRARVIYDSRRARIA